MKRVSRASGETTLQVLAMTCVKALKRKGSMSWRNMMRSRPNDNRPPQDHRGLYRQQSVLCSDDFVLTCQQMVGVWGGRQAWGLCAQKLAWDFQGGI